MTTRVLHYNWMERELTVNFRELNRWTLRFLTSNELYFFTLGYLMGGGNHAKTAKASKAQNNIRYQIAARARLLHRTIGQDAKMIFYVGNSGEEVLFKVSLPLGASEWKNQGEKYKYFDYFGYVKKSKL